MAVKIRLARAGAKKAPFYRIVAADTRSPRDGRFIEILGRYNPRTDPISLELDVEKVDVWVSKGAQMSETASKLYEIAKNPDAPAPEKKSAPSKKAQAKAADEAAAAEKAAEEAAAAEKAAAEAPAEDTTDEDADAVDDEVAEQAQDAPEAAEESADEAEDAADDESAE